MQIGRKRGRGEVSSGKGGIRGALEEEPSGSGSLLGSQDSLSLAASQGVQRILQPELDRAFRLSKDAASESMDSRPRTGIAGSRALPESDASSTSSLLQGTEGGRIRLSLSFDGIRDTGADASSAPGGGFAPGDGSASAPKHSAAQQGSTVPDAASVPGGHADGPGPVSGITSTLGKPADTARRKAVTGDGVGPEHENSISAIDGVVLEDSIKQLDRQHSDGHLDGVALPDGADGVAGLQGKKRTPGKLVDVHASAEDRLAAGKDGAGEAAPLKFFSMAEHDYMVVF